MSDKQVNSINEHMDNLRDIHENLRAIKGDVYVEGVLTLAMMKAFIPVVAPEARRPYIECITVQVANLMLAHGLNTEQLAEFLDDALREIERQAVVSKVVVSNLRDGGPGLSGLPPFRRPR